MDERSSHLDKEQMIGFGEWCRSRPVIFFSRMPRRAYYL